MSIFAQQELLIQGLEDLFTLSLQNDDVQDFGVRWDHTLLSGIEMPSDMILEGSHKSKLQDSMKNSKLQSPIRNSGERSSYQESKAKKAYVAYVARKVGECYH